MSDQEVWDVFESESLSVRRAQTPEQIRNALASKELTEDDLTRPAGSSTPWKRLGDVIGEWHEKSAVSSAESTSAAASGLSSGTSVPGMADDLELVNPDIEIEMDSSGEIVPGDEPTPVPSVLKPVSPEAVTKPAAVLSWLSESDSEESLEDVEIEPPAAKPVPVNQVSDEVEAEPDEKWLEPSVQLMPDESSRNDLGSFTGHSDDDDEEEEFTLSRSSVEKVDELDLAAMVDVAFQLVLFFMVTASVTLIKTMDLPKPTESTKPAAASAPGVGTKSKNEVETEFIVVAITADGDITVDDEPASIDQLVESLRQARTTSGKTGMLLRAENKTKHRTAVAAYDAANAIGLRIAIERESTD